MNNILTLIIVNIIVAIAGWKQKSLTISGSIATMIVGTLVSIGFGYKGLIILGVFFVSSSMWSKYKKKQKQAVENKVAKGDQRDFIQVFANGGVAAIAGILYTVTQSNVWIYVFIGSIAAACADTWASEIGTLSKRKPILVSKLKRVEAGTSGAISILGTIAGFAGAVVIASFSYFLWDGIHFYSLVILSLIGFIGNIIDTVLGGYVQVLYKCTNCGIETEKISHCGKKTTYLKGISFFNNDVVNFLSIFLASLLAFVLFNSI
ncbi:DUF92 domain-containing protein [Ferdinandcohnia quinoae]|uniref:DUF92 domain-containing protein n=1 Tax=Fredinandcohnia quinoae TaxID=2918902 RepID=A0AAW5DWC3_9BACI|nr:DUF92 domain-containing protein [Fredinandcohnia sp. SECRCQ15]MCH1624931.1 DUF92 domain-containing protein [Fredinandcohnia sp. SECRCQ15]